MGSMSKGTFGASSSLVLLQTPSGVEGSEVAREEGRGQWAKSLGIQVVTGDQWRLLSREDASLLSNFWTIPLSC